MGRASASSASRRSATSTSSSRLRSSSSRSSAPTTASVAISRWEAATCASAIAITREVCSTALGIDARVEQLPEPLGGLEVGPSLRPLLAVADRKAERSPLGLEHVRLDADPLGHLERRVALAAREHTLGGDQRKAPAVDRLAQLLDADPGVVQAPQERLQALPCLLAVDAVEQSL